MNYITQEQYAETCSLMDERAKLVTERTALKAAWKANGCRMTLASKAKILSDYKQRESALTTRILEIR